MTAFISEGDLQLFVKPASSSFSEQMNVRSSTRATSVGSDAAWNEFGFLLGLRRVKVPASTSSVVRRSHSSSDPVTHSTAAGVVRAATSSTQACRPAWLVPCPVCSACVVMVVLPPVWAQLVGHLERARASALLTVARRPPLGASIPRYARAPVAGDRGSACAL